MRREEKERQKAQKDKSPQGKWKRAAEQGRLDGRMIASSIINCILYEQYGFRKKRLLRFIEQCNREALKFDQEATRFTIEMRAEKLIEKMNSINANIKIRGTETAVYVETRNTYLVSSCGVSFMVLNQYFEFGSNDNGTGRLDLITEYIANEYLKMMLDPKGHSADYYKRKLRKVTGLDI